LDLQKYITYSNKLRFLLGGGEGEMPTPLVSYRVVSTSQSELDVLSLKFIFFNGDGGLPK
jgi:hypothetical protein